MMRMPRVWVMVLLALMALGTGCARSPEAKKARHLERGDKYFAREQYRDAILEYRNALRYEDKNAHAMRQAGLAFYNLRELGQAYAFLLRAQGLDPNNLEVRLRLGSLYLVGGKPKEAAEEAEFVLEKDPRNAEALFLVAGAARSPEEVTAAIRRLEAAQKDIPNKAAVDLALARLHIMQRDPTGAERVLLQAVAKEPKSVEARMALADFYMIKRDTARAEQEYKSAAAIAPAGSPARVRLADFLLLQQKPDEAKRVLTEITEQAPAYLPAWRRLAEIALREKRYDDCVKLVKVLLAKNSSDLDGHLLLGQVHMAREETDKAIQEFQTVLKLEPRLAQAHYLLGLTQLQAGNVQQAKNEFNEAIVSAPNFADATLRLAQLNLQEGALQPAIQALEKLVATQPSPQAWELLGMAYLAKRDPAKAVDSFRKLMAMAPKEPRGPMFLGLALIAQNKRVEASREFEASLALAPDFPDALRARADGARGEEAGCGTGTGQPPDRARPKVGRGLSSARRGPRGPGRAESSAAGIRQGHRAGSAPGDLVYPAGVHLRGVWQ